MNVIKRIFFPMNMRVIGSKFKHTPTRTFNCTNFNKIILFFTMPKDFHFIYPFGFGVFLPLITFRLYHRFQKCQYLFEKIFVPAKLVITNSRLKEKRAEALNGGDGGS